MKKRLAALLFAAAVLVAGCGGGGSTGGGGIPGGGGGGPTPTPTPAAQGNLPLSESAGSSMAWVNPSTHRTLYFLDVDTATGGTCTGGCLGIWPVFSAQAGSVGADNMSVITRSDGTGQQWAYQGHPLYMYAGDNGPDQTNGDGIPDFGGHWHVARPTSSATPPPGDPGCHGYC
jgi:predicted lipoprotein with Yx(FWY)xxD motif